LTGLLRGEGRGAGGGEEKRNAKGRTLGVILEHEEVGTVV